MPHGAYTVSSEHLKDAKSIADADRGLFCTHAAETRAEQADIQNRYGRHGDPAFDAHGLLGSAPFWRIVSMWMMAKST